MTIMTTLTTKELNALGEGIFPGLVGVQFVDLTEDRVVARLDVRSRHLAPNYTLHAACLVTLADTACGYGTMASLPEGAESFTTIELKMNFQGAVRDGGAIRCVASLMHGGRTTQIWDATVTDEANGRTLGLFRCTQLILYPRRGDGAGNRSGG